MSTKQDDLIFSCDRLLAAVAETKQNAVKLAQLEGEIKRAEDTLAALNGQIAQARTLTSQLETVEQQIRAKARELAELEMVIAKKHEAHGAVTSALRDLRKQISADPSHA